MQNSKVEFKIDQEMLDTKIDINVIPLGISDFPL